MYEQCVLLTDIVRDVTYHSGSPYARPSVCLYVHRDGIKSTGDTKWVVLQMRRRDMIGNGCEHLSIAWHPLPRL